MRAMIAPIPKLPKKMRKNSPTATRMEEKEIALFRKVKKVLYKTIEMASLNTDSPNTFE